MKYCEDCTYSTDCSSHVGRRQEEMAELARDRDEARAEIERLKSEDAVLEHNYRNVCRSDAALRVEVERLRAALKLCLRDCPDDPCFNPSCVEARAALEGK